MYVVLEPFDGLTLAELPAEHTIQLVGQTAVVQETPIREATPPATKACDTTSAQART